MYSPSGTDGPELTPEWPCAAGSVTTGGKFCTIGWAPLHIEPWLNLHGNVLDMAENRNSAGRTTVLIRDLYIPVAKVLTAKAIYVLV